MFAFANGARKEIGINWVVSSIDPYDGSSQKFIVFIHENVYEYLDRKIRV